MKYLKILLIVGFISMSLFGFTVISHEMADHSGSDCFGSFVLGSCSGGGLFAHVIHHIEAYKSFSDTLIVSTKVFISVLSLMFLFAVFSRDGDSRFFLKNLVLLLRRRMTLSADFVCLRLKKISRWLSLLENSPSVS